MANLTEVQLPNGTTYKIVDDESGYQTEAQVDAKIAGKADKTLVVNASCSTAAATAQKEVVVPEGWTLEAGRMIAVKFVNTNTANNPTLKVGSAAAKPIYYNTGAVTTSNLFAGGEASKVTLFQYDGTNWVWLGHSIDNNTTYSAMSVSELTTGTATTSRTARADYLKNGINQLIQTKATADLTSIAITGSVNNTGSPIESGVFFYKDGILCRAIADIANNATLTLNTNYVSAVLGQNVNYIEKVASNKGMLDEGNPYNFTMPNGTTYLDIRPFYLGANVKKAFITIHETATVDVWYELLKGVAICTSQLGGEIEAQVVWANDGNIHIAYTVNKKGADASCVAKLKYIN